MDRQRGEEIAGRFTVIGTVGQGGMGVVYAVTDRRFSGSPRALKMLHAGSEGDARLRERFGQEVTAVAGIKSDHVVSVMDYDITVAAPWMLMELLEGETLEARVATRGALPWDEARRLVLELGHGLGAAHAANVLHLDLKPSNVFLAKTSDAYGTTRLKVMDFGLSRQMRDGRTHATQSRAVGTEIWMPPEQFNKKAALRPTADVWPLGLIAFWMLTAKYYWLAVDDRGDVEDMVPYYGELRAGARVPASLRAMERRSDRVLPEGFDAWFARCVAVDPASRWPNGKEATDVLEALLAKASVLRPPTTPPTRSVHVQTAEAMRPIPPVGLTAPVQVLLPDAYVPPRTATTVPVSPDVSATDAPRRSSTGLWRGVMALLVVGVLTSWAAHRAFLLRAASRVSPRPTPILAAVPIHPVTAQRVEIPGRTYVMGAGNPVGADGPHTVTVQTFWMDRTEVTVEAYGRCVTAGTCTAPTPITVQRCNWGMAGREHHPINCVDWRQAAAYCAWAGGRLPTEAEWEYAARGTDERTYPWGNAVPDFQLCWSGMQERRGTCSVGRTADGRSAYGLDDMAGNVWEWTSDWYGPYRTQGVASSGENRVYRGGSWDDVDASSIRTYKRYWGRPADRGDYLGFRCAGGGT